MTRMSACISTFIHSEKDHLSDSVLAGFYYYGLEHEHDAGSGGAYLLTKVLAKQLLAARGKKPEDIEYEVSAYFPTSGSFVDRPAIFKNGQFVRHVFDDSFYCPKCGHVLLEACGEISCSECNWKRKEQTL